MMDAGDFEQLKQFLRDNLIISCEFEYKYIAGNNQKITLSFKDEDKPFCETMVYIPED